MRPALCRRRSLATVVSVIATFMVTLLVRSHVVPEIHVQSGSLDTAGDEYFLQEEYTLALNAMLNTSEAERKINESSVTKVVLVTYQRSGSSFLGEVFNQNSDALSWFEPLDGIYTGLFGTQNGFNVPADIWNFRNASPRAPLREEMELIINVSSSILDCQFRHLPVEVLMHNFIEMFQKQHRRLTPYVRCIQKDEPTFSDCRKCNTDLANVCPKRFNTENVRMQMCANEIAYQRDPVSEAPFPGVTPSKAIKESISKYLKCVAPCLTKALKCVNFLEFSCQRARIRTIKPVRMTMEAARRMQAASPGVKIIHNIRDPRGIVHSRAKVSESFQSGYAMVRIKRTKRKQKTRDANNYGTTVHYGKEAALLCQNMLYDIKRRHDVERTQPNATLQVVYEDYASNPQQVAKAIYDFIGHPFPPEVAKWLRDNTSGEKVDAKEQTSRQSNATMSKWMDSIAVHQMAEINTQCSDLFLVTGRRWPFT